MRSPPNRDSLTDEEEIAEHNLDCNVIPKDGPGYVEVFYSDESVGEDDIFLYRLAGPISCVFN